MTIQDLEKQKIQENLNKVNKILNCQENQEKLDLIKNLIKISNLKIEEFLSLDMERQNDFLIEIVKIYKKYFPKIPSGKNSYENILTSYEIQSFFEEFKLNFHNVQETDLNFFKISVINKNDIDFLKNYFKSLLIDINSENLG